MVYNFPSHLSRDPPPSAALSKSALDAYRSGEPKMSPVGVGIHEEHLRAGCIGIENVEFDEFQI
jgi:hypothetical protein